MNLHSKNNNLQHTTPDIDHCQTARIAELLQYYATAADTWLTHTGVRQRGTRTFMHIHALNAVPARTAAASRVDEPQAPPPSLSSRSPKPKPLIVRPHTHPNSSQRVGQPKTAMQLQPTLA